MTCNPCYLGRALATANSNAVPAWKGIVNRSDDHESSPPESLSFQQAELDTLHGLKVQESTHMQPLNSCHAARAFVTSRRVSYSFCVRRASWWRATVQKSSKSVLIRYTLLHVGGQAGLGRISIEFYS